MALILRESVETSVSITASTLVLDKNARRKYALISCPTGGGSLSLGFGNAAVAGKGVTVPPGGAYEIDSDNLWTGQIFAIASAGTIIAAVVDQN